MNPTKIAESQDILDFWFSSKNADKRFQKDEAFDQEIWDRFGPTWIAACQGLLSHWRGDIYGRLAEIIVLDQFSRNLMRGDARSYSQDGMALILAQELVAHPNFEELTQEERQFGLMPYMHSESAQIHEQALSLFQEHTGEGTLHYEELHKELIDRFGRYPHRNEVLGRTSSWEEIAYLKQPDAGF